MNESAPQPPATARLHPDDQARMAARSEGNQLANVEEYSHDYTRAQQAGEREAIEAALESRRTDIKLHRRKACAARRRRNRLDDEIRQPGTRAALSASAIVLLVFLILGLLGAILAEQNGASQALLDTGAFSVDSIGKGILLTMTAVTVGFALKLAYNAMPPLARRLTFGLACLALVALFFLWSWSFATGARVAAEESARTTQSFPDSGEKDGAFGESEEVAAPVTSPGEAGAAAWRMFFALVSMMPLTAFVGHVGIEAYVGKFETRIPNPEHRRAADDVRFHENEGRRLDREMEELHRRVAILVNEEKHTVSHSRTLYFDERARLAGGGPLPPSGQS